MHLHRFLSFLASYQKNLNFQRYLERVQLLTCYFKNHRFSSLETMLIRKIQKIRKNQNLQKKEEKRRKGKVEGLI